jgi:hypothetical protein
MGRGHKLKTHQKSMENKTDDQERAQKTWKEQIPNISREK